MKLTIYICSHWNSYSKEFNTSVQHYPPYEESSLILMATQEIEFEPLPDPVLRNAAVTILRAAKQRVLANAHADALKLDEEAQELLALPAPEAE